MFVLHLFLVLNIFYNLSSAGPSVLNLTNHLKNNFDHKPNNEEAEKLKNAIKVRGTDETGLVTSHVRNPVESVLNLHQVQKHPTIKVVSEVNNLCNCKGDNIKKPDKMKLNEIERELVMLNEEIMYLEKKITSQLGRSMILSTGTEINIMLDLIDSLNNSLPLALGNKIDFLKNKVLSLKQMFLRYFRNIIDDPITSQVRLLESQLDKMTRSKSSVRYRNQINEVKKSLNAVKYQLSSSVDTNTLKVLVQLLTKLVNQLKNLDKEDPQGIIGHAIRTFQNIIKTVKKSSYDIPVHNINRNEEDNKTGKIGYSQHLHFQDRMNINVVKNAIEEKINILVKEVESLKYAITEKMSRSQIITVDIQIDAVHSQIEELGRNSSNLSENVKGKIINLRETVSALKQEVKKHFQTLFVNPLLSQITLLRTRLEKMTQSNTSKLTKQQSIQIEKYLQDIEMQMKHSHEPQSLEQLENSLTELMSHLKDIQNKQSKENVETAFPFIEDVVGDIKHSFYIVHIHHMHTGKEHKRRQRNEGNKGRQTHFESEMQIEKELSKLIKEIENLKRLSEISHNRTVIIYIDMEIHNIQSEVEQLERNVTLLPDFLRAKINFLNEVVSKIKLDINNKFQKQFVNPVKIQISTLEAQLEKIKQSKPSRKLKNEIKDIEKNLYGIKIQLQSSTEPKILEQLEFSMIKVMERLNDIEKDYRKGFFSQAIYLFNGFVQDIARSFYKMINMF